MVDPTPLLTDSQFAREIRADLLAITDKFEAATRRGLRVSFTISSVDGEMQLTTFECVKVVEI